MIIAFSYGINRRNRQIECFDKVRMISGLNSFVENVQHLRFSYFAYNKYTVYNEKLKSVKLTIFRVFSLF